jgi:hypothetical protein
MSPTQTITALMLRTYVVFDELFTKDFPCIPLLLDRDSGLSTMEICLPYDEYVIRRREGALTKQSPAREQITTSNTEQLKKKPNFIPALHYRYSLCTTHEA